MICSSCNREVTKMHPDFRQRLSDGRWGHLELDRETGATVLVVEPDPPQEHADVNAHTCRGCGFLFVCSVPACREPLPLCPKCETKLGAW